jgi:mycofactocin precursor
MEGLPRLSLSAAPAATYRPTTDPSRGGPVEQTETPQNSGTEDGVVEETLVEEVSIDGMCGVY